MLELKKIVKDYPVGDQVVEALKGLNLFFRKNEFVSVLGPSGCGKTTLLNIIGGLDHATSGELLINGKSTKNYKSRDWDVYRNHRIGFVFQSYNLIPHQTVLSNVELSLTIAGMSRKERIAKAKKALDRVGLADQYHKKPNQLSGGQCQRVAIARALVNDPEILLADEPTGALDTVTSTQIMDLISEVAQERLVIMVTHNGELAKRYSTRIIRMLDGEILSDSNPVSKRISAPIQLSINGFVNQDLVWTSSNQEIATVKDGLVVPQGPGAVTITAQTKKSPITTSKYFVEVEAEPHQQNGLDQKERAKMSLGMAFKLSLNNLFSKRKRSVLTSIASSIGIIGISLVLSMSYGVTTYINKMQNDMLSGNPIVVSETTLDISSFLNDMTIGEQASLAAENGFVNIEAMLEEVAKRAKEMENMFVSNNIQQDYLDYLLAMPQDYSADIVFDYAFDITNNLYLDYYEETNGTPVNLSITALKAIFTAILGDEPQTADYASLVMGLENVFQPSLEDEQYLLSQYDVLEGRLAKEKNEVMIVLDNDSMLTDLLLTQLGYYTQDEFVNLIYKVAEDDRYDETQDVRTKISYQELMSKTFTYYSNDALYTPNPMSIIPGIPGERPFIYYSGYSSEGKTGFSNVALEGGLELEIVGILEPKEDLNYGSLQTGFFYTQEMSRYFIEDNKDSIVAQYLLDSGEGSYGLDAASVLEGIEEMKFTSIPFTYSYTMLDGSPSGLKSASVGSTNFLSQMIPGMSVGASIPTLTYRDLCGGKIIETEENGVTTLTSEIIPSRIAIYSTDLEQKDLALKYLDQWNMEVDIQIGDKVLAFNDREKITYTDTLSLIFSMISTVINIITIALIAFTALALFVSCVMIAIITYISVVERTKEIGVIRSLGGRKADVSNLFVCETVIIGGVAGIIAILFTYLASFIINAITLPHVGTTIAIFPWFYAVLMLVLSIALTLISGFIPSRSAAKKDPVTALRTE